MKTLDMMGYINGGSHYFGPYWTILGHILDHILDRILNRILDHFRMHEIMFDHSVDQNILNILPINNIR